MLLSKYLFQVVRICIHIIVTIFIDPGNESLKQVIALTLEITPESVSAKAAYSKVITILSHINTV